MKFILNAAIWLCGIALVAILGGGYLYITYIAAKPSSRVVENALATDDLLLFSRVKIAQISFLEKWFLGQPIAELSSKKSLSKPAGERTLIDHMLLAGINPRKNLDRGYAAAYFKSSFQYAYILTGQFDVANVTTYLKQAAQPIQISSSAVDVFSFTQKDSKTCQMKNPIHVAVTESWILISTPDVTSTLLARLESESAPEIDVADLSDLSKMDQAVALVRIPETPPKIGGITGVIAEKLKNQLADFKWIKVGLGLGLTPPSVSLRAGIRGKNAEQALARVNAWRETIEQSKKAWVDELPTFAKIHDHLKIENDNEVTKINAQVDRQFVSELAQIPQEVFKLIFSGFTSKIANAPDAKKTEQIEQNPRKYIATTSEPDIKPFDPKDFFGESTDAINGPVGVRLESLSLSKETTGGLEANIKALTSEIPNVNGDSKRATLHIDSVKVVNGEELLIKEDCGTSVNQEPAFFADTFGTKLRGEKTIRLSKTAQHNNLKSITGRVEIRLPIKTEIVNIKMADKNKTATRVGTTVVLSGAQGARFDFQISGTTDRVLGFTALNANGQPLQFRSSMSSGFMFGEGISGSKEFAGDIESVDVAFAIEEKPLSFSFTLTDFRFLNTSSGFSSTSKSFTDYSYLQLIKEFSMNGRDFAWKPLPAPEKKNWDNSNVTGWKQKTFGPFETKLERLDSGFGLSASLEIRAPLVPAWQDMVKVGEVRLSRIGLNDGTVLTPPEVERTTSSVQSMIDYKWKDPLEFLQNTGSTTLLSKPNFRIDSKVKKEDVRKIEGVIHARFPRSHRSLRINQLYVGDKFEFGKLSGVVQKRTRSTLTLSVNEPDSVLALNALDSTGKGVQAFPVSFKQIGVVAGELTINPLREFSALELIVSDNFETRDFSFVLEK